MWEWNTDIGPPSGIENIFFPPTQQLKVYSILISPDPRKEKKKSQKEKSDKHVADKNKTGIWRVGCKGGGDGETELEALPHPHAQAPFLFQRAGKAGRGTKVQRAVL